MPNKVTLIFFVLFTIAGSVFGLYGIRDGFRAYTSTGWPSVKGEVIASEVEKRRNGNSKTYSYTYFALVTYTFSIDGEPRTQNRLSYGNVGKGEPEHATEVASAYPVGKQVTVYYMESNPEISVLEPGVTAATFLRPGIGLAMALMGVGTLYLQRRKPNSRKKILRA